MRSSLTLTRTWYDSVSVESGRSLASGPTVRRLTLDLMGSDVEDVVAMITSLPQSKDLFAGQPEDKVEAAINGLRNGFAPYAGPEGVVMSGTAWLLTARS